MDNGYAAFSESTGKKAGMWVHFIALSWANFISGREKLFFSSTKLKYILKWKEQWGEPWDDLILGFVTFPTFEPAEAKPGEREIDRWMIIATHSFKTAKFPQERQII